MGARQVVTVSQREPTRWCHEQVALSAVRIWRHDLQVETRIAADFFQVAMEILAAEGRNGLTIAELCKRLEVSKGSFYHHFDGLPQFIEAFLQDWEASFSQWWMLADTTYDAAERFNAAFGLLISMNHPADAAIRAWGNSDATVAAAIGRRDVTVEYAYEHTLASVGVPCEQRRVKAQVAMSLLAGLQIRGNHDPRYLLAVARECHRALCGVDSELVEIDGDLVLRAVRETLGEPAPDWPPAQ
jgi:AcrR family transcriptional regulator